MGPGMLTRMTEEDWALALEVFDAAQSSRGEPGRDDRKFLEGHCQINRTGLILGRRWEHGAVRSSFAHTFPLSKPRKPWHALADSCSPSFDDVADESGRR
jgi:hypothetical protein